MAASQGCWARGLDGPWACGREDLSSGSSRAWLAGLDPCVAMQRAAQCILELQLQMQYQPAGRRSMAHSSEMCTVRRRGGGHRWLYASLPSQPASNVHTYGRPDHRRRRTASAARYAWHARMICSSSGWASCAACLLVAGWPGGREAPFGGTWLCGFPH